MVLKQFYYVCRVLWLVVLVPAVFIHADTLAGKPSYRLSKRFAFSSLIGSFWFTDGIYAECLDNRVQFTIHGSLGARGPSGVYAVSKFQASHCSCSYDFIDLGINSRMARFR